MRLLLKISLILQNLQSICDLITKRTKNLSWTQWTNHFALFQTLVSDFNGYFNELLKLFTRNQTLDLTCTCLHIFDSITKTQKPLKTWVLKLCKKLVPWQLRSRFVRTSQSTLKVPTSHHTNATVQSQSLRTIKMEGKNTLSTHNHTSLGF